MTPPAVVCGTDTDVGKTIVSAWLVQGLQTRTSRCRVASRTVVIVDGCATC